MNLASRIHGHFHPPDDTAQQSDDTAQQSDDTAQQPDDTAQQSAPLWVRHYDGLVRLVSLGRVAKLHQGTLDLVGLAPNQALLDIGCGTGELILRAEELVGGQGTFVGLDVEAAMITQAHRKAAEAGSGATFAEAGIESIPYPDESFHAVTSSLMFHHLTPAQQSDGLAELHRVLKPGGRLAIADINTARRSLVSRFPGHRHLEQGDPVREQVAKLLHQAGFTGITTGTHRLKALSYATGTKG